jgi:hypothetical protein
LIPINTNNTTNTTNSTNSTTTNTTLPTNSTSNNSASNNSLPVPNNQVSNQSEEKTFFIDIVDTIMTNKPTEVVNSIPGNRIFLNQLTEFLSIFDRLYLYYYHTGNCTEYGTIFFQKIKQINAGKSSLCQLIF